MTESMGAHRQLGRRETPGSSTARPYLYPDASHAINGEYPDRLCDDVAAFVAKNS
ncbi:MULTISPECIES: hypothetical protein [unclassified Rhodococcus (in: high G+C Gram-positive bacteria)]|uniref:hypothetical protein n=2 Tax=Rhodococcus TaxID=1827 RepID=UPI001596357D|nr:MULTISPECIES: hypothetical protein [unclassified Rhodococcus (in: high G+C Gram-positive bacteria)]MDI9925630.1 hypothetical protein [Rhodococcus sp. IEGM 1341]MDV7988608.1 hypothetical protein [Rhodococcus sp. IEGM 1374]